MNESIRTNVLLYIAGQQCNSLQETADLTCLLWWASTTPCVCQRHQRHMRHHPGNRNIIFPIPLPIDRNYCLLLRKLFVQINYKCHIYMTTIYIQSCVISGRPGATMQYITSHPRQHSISLVDLPSTLRHIYHTDL